jgi:hypothetical protein
MGAAGGPGARSPSARTRPTRTRQLLSSAASSAVWVLTPGPSEVTATAAALGWVLCWWLLMGVLAEHAVATRWMELPLLPALAARAGEVVLTPPGLLLAALLVPAVTLAPLGLLGRGRRTARAYAVAIGFALAGVVLVVGAAQSWHVRPQDESFARLGPTVALAGGAAAIGCGLWLANGWRRLVADTLRAPRGTRGEEALRTLVVGGPWVAALVVPTLAVRPLADLVAIGPASPTLLPSTWTVPATLAALALGVAAALRLRAPHPDEVVAAPVVAGAPPAGEAWHLVVPASVACVVAWWGLLLMLALESSRLTALFEDAGVSLQQLPLLLLLGRWLHHVPSAAMAGIAVPAVVGLALALGARDRRAALTLGLGTVLMPLLAALVVGEFAEAELFAVPRELTRTAPGRYALPALDPWVPTTTFAVAALVLGGIVAAAWGALSVQQLRAPRATARLEVARILAIAVLPTLGGSALAFAATGPDGLSRGLVELVLVVSLCAATVARWRALAR